jgi:UDP-glucose 4-epimerase
MKLACEAAISAAVEDFLERAFIFRFPNVVGIPATHGVIFDFIHRLRQMPEKLIVLGNGTQQKSYLHVDDLIDAMLFIRDKSDDKLAYFNIGPEDEGATVRFIAEETVAVVSPGAEIVFGDQPRGWVGDVPRFRYSVEKLKTLGWHKETSSADALRRAIRQIAAQDSLQ